MAEKFVVFEDAAKELKMSQDELKKLVDDRKLRSFMDSGKMKFRREDLDNLKASMGIVQEDEELSLAPADELPPMPPLAADDEDVPAPPAAREDALTVEPLDDAPKASSAPAARRPEPAAGDEEVASLSDFEITDEVEEQGEELGEEEEAELLSVQAQGFRAYEEPQASNVAMTALTVASAVVVGFAAVMVLSAAWGVNISFLTQMFK